MTFISLGLQNCIHKLKLMSVKIATCVILYMVSLKRISETPAIILKSLGMRTVYTGRRWVSM